jgi:hypothetical protein
MQFLERYLRFFVFITTFCVSPILHSQQQPSVHYQKVEKYVLSLKAGAMCERRAAIAALHQMGKEAIPILIARIGDADVAKSSTLMLANPALSYVPPDSQRDAYSGVVYAYVIELILARESLNTGTGDCMFLLDPRDYAYGHGLIMKGQNVIRASELNHVKQLYSKWWETHRNEDLYALRSDWQRSMRPLTGSAYHWF